MDAPSSKQNDSRQADLASLEQENAALRQRLSAHEHSYALLQAELTQLRRQWAAVEEQQQGLPHGHSQGEGQEGDRSAARNTQQLKQQDPCLNQWGQANTTLKKILDVLATDPNLDNALGHMLRVISEELGAISSAFWLAHPGTDRFFLHLVYLDGTVIPAIPEQAHRLTGQWIAGVDLSKDLAFKQHVRDRLPIIYDLHHHPDVRPAYRRIMQRLGVKTVLGVPLLIEDDVVGSFTLRFSHHYQFQPGELELIQALSHQATLAIQLTQLAEVSKQAAIAREREKATQEWATELARTNAAMHRVLALTARNTGFDSVVGNILQAAAEQLDAPIVEWWETIDDVTVAKRLSYFKGQLLSEREMASHHGVPYFSVPIVALHSESILTRRKHIIIEDVAQLPYSASEIAKIQGWYGWHGASKLLNTPVIVDDRSIGGLLIFLPKHRSFSESQIKFSYAMARYLALAILMSRRAEEAQQINEARLNEMLAREQEKAAQDQAIELTKANNALKRSFAAIAIDASPHQVIAEILPIVAEHFDAPLVEYWSHSANSLTAHVYLTYWQQKLLTPDDQPHHPGNVNFPCFVGLSRSGVMPPGDLNSPAKELPYLLIDDVATDEYIARASEQIGVDVAAWYLARGVRRLLNIPLWLKDRTIGALDVWMPGDRPFNPSNIELARTFGQQITLATYISQLFEEAKQTVLFEERNRIASDIHDTLAQAFTGISLQLEVAKPLVYQEPATVERILYHISQLAKNGLEEARRSVWELYPPGAEYANLAQLLYDSVEQMSRNTPTVLNVEIVGTPQPIHPFVGMNILRIGQEALTNALKHAQAQTVSIELTYAEDLIALTIRDDGRGFSPPLHPEHLNGGFGLVGMYERCDRIGAQLSIISQPGQGTQILVEAPVM